MKEVYFGGGCFWGVEEYFARQDGVVKTEAGYANGDFENPSYEQVCTGLTGHAEVVRVKFDEEVISFKDLLNKFWKIINPTLENRQGPDMGPQYRTAIYYKDDKDLETINETLELVKTQWKDPIKTEIEALSSFYPAEEYHQRFLKKNPHRFCHIDLDA